MSLTLDLEAKRQGQNEDVQPLQLTLVLRYRCHPAVGSGLLAICRFLLKTYCIDLSYHH
jgi:hypothetical protein